MSDIPTPSFKQHAHKRKLLISIVMNKNSGYHALESITMHDALVDYFNQQGCEVSLYLADKPADIAQLAKQALIQHRAQGGILVAAGGDGTLNAIARVLLHEPIPMGIIPLGTFNYVARSLHIPLDPLKAAAIILQGQPHQIHVGCVNQYIYLNNASIGLYPRVIEQREQDHSRFGRFRAVAMLSGFLMLISEHQKLQLSLVVDGQVEAIESSLIFFGNNQLQLHDFKMYLENCAAQGKLAAVVIKKVSRLKMLSLLARLYLGGFEQAPEVTEFCAEHIRIEAKLPSIKLAIDGEIVTAKNPLNFSIAKSALTIIVPTIAPTMVADAAS